METNNSMQEKERKREGNSSLQRGLVGSLIFGFCVSQALHYYCLDVGHGSFRVVYSLSFVVPSDICYSSPTSRMIL